jgi:deferrochelatase/peroxidase EfeB
MPVDKSDVQGLVRTAFNDLEEACYLLVRIRDRAAARAWLRSAIAHVNDSVSPKEDPSKPRPVRAMQLAFSWDCLLKLGLSPDTKDGFSLEFQSGMNGDDNRCRRLGDVGHDAPAHWEWGAGDRAAEMVVILFAEKKKLDPWKHEAKGNQWDAAFHELACLDSFNLPKDVEPFGFKDGMSQPRIDWELSLSRTTKTEERAFGNLIAAGEFLLGHPNEYGKVTERPLVDEQDDPRKILASAEDVPGKRDFGLNGTYLVFRDLLQDVRGFWQFFDRQSGGDRETRMHLAAQAVGRTTDGDPLVPLVPHPIPGIDPDEPKNNFTYDDDPIGVRCPVGAHVRRANPRVADLPAGTHGFVQGLQRLLGFGAKRPEDDLISSVRFHRLLRRGREHGPELTPDAAVTAEPDNVQRGLRFICLNANITRQFEFVQQAWAMGTKFAGLTDQSDPVLGNRTPVEGSLTTSAFLIPQEAGLARCVQGLPQFVSVRGGGYFFLPSLRAVRYLASLGE